MNAPLKTLLVSAMSVVSVVAAITYSSCNRDQCKSIVCANKGVCSGGKCTCPSGYEGSNCETVSRTKFLGNWHVFEKGSVTNAAQYPISIEPTTQVTDVVIRNFYNYFRTPILGKVYGDTLYIPNQQYEGKVVFGIGYIYSNVTYGQYGSIVMRYEVIDTATQLVNDFGYYAADGSDPSMWNK